MNQQQDSVQLADARRRLGELVDEAARTGRHIALTRWGVPAVVLVPFDWHEKHRHCRCDQGASLAPDSPDV